MNIKCKITEWKKEKKWTLFYGTARPLDENIYKYTKEIIICETMLHRTGHKLSETTINVGDIVELEVIAYGYRMFNHEPKPEN